MTAGYDVPHVPLPADWSTGGDVPGEALGAVTVTLAAVQPEHVQWLWPGRLPLGKLVVLDGDPAVGKSTLAVDLAARVTIGTRWPDGTDCPAGDVLILSAEDGLADTIRPRLDAASGDPARVHALTDVRYREDDGTVRTRTPTLADAGAGPSGAAQRRPTGRGALSSRTSGGACPVASAEERFGWLASEISRVRRVVS